MCVGFRVNSGQNSKSLQHYRKEQQPHKYSIHISFSRRTSSEGHYRMCLPLTPYGSDRLIYSNRIYCAVFPINQNSSCTPWPVGVCQHVRQWPKPRRLLIHIFAALLNTIELILEMYEPRDRRPRKKFVIQTLFSITVTAAIKLLYKFSTCLCNRDYKFLWGEQPDPLYAP